MSRKTNQLRKRLRILEEQGPRLLAKQKTEAASILCLQEQAQKDLQESRTLRKEIAVERMKLVQLAAVTMLVDRPAGTGPRREPLMGLEVMFYPEEFRLGALHHGRNLAPGGFNAYVHEKCQEAAQKMYTAIMQQIEGNHGVRG